MTSFKKKFPLQKRIDEAARILKKYPDRVPVIVEKAEKSDITEIDKNKYLVPSDLTVAQFIYVIRKRLSINADQAIFIFINNTLPVTSSMMLQIYNEYKDNDGFLYIKYSGESTFG